jgi:hypothetical protein
MVGPVTKARLAGHQNEAQSSAMSYRTVEVEIDHGRVSAKGAEVLPEQASGLLTILVSAPLSQSPLMGHTTGQFPVADDCIAPLPALEALQEQLQLDAAAAAEWMATVREARR